MMVDLTYLTSIPTNNNRNNDNNRRNKVGRGTNRNSELNRGRWEISLKRLRKNVKVLKIVRGIKLNSMPWWKVNWLKLWGKRRKSRFSISFSLPFEFSSSRESTRYWCTFHIPCSGNLSMRSLADVVSAEDFAGTNDSEYLETILVAVPKWASHPVLPSLCYSFFWIAAPTIYRTS